MSFDNFILPLSPEKAQKRAKQIYYATDISVLVCLPLAMVLAIMLVKQQLHLPQSQWYFVFVMFFNGFFTRISKRAAIWACRRMGISRESQHRETIHRDLHAVPESLLGEAPALSIGKPDKPCARINGEGIERRRWRGGPLFVAWRDVEWCTYDTSRDVVGHQNPIGLTQLRLWRRRGWRPLPIDSRRIGGGRQPRLKLWPA